jgi:hypothetical protein
MNIWMKKAGEFKKISMNKQIIIIKDKKHFKTIENDINAFKSST